MNLRKKVKNCYIHIPFCNNICSYCDFCKRYYNKKFINEYLISLEKEIDKYYKEEELDTIYIGGGTPSSLDLDELKLLFKIINKLKRSSNCSITIENNFESTTHEKLDLYKEFGVNRLSFGLESINKNNLNLMEREVDINHVKDIIAYSKQIGLKDINIDLMYALPNEDLNILNKDLDFILSLDITHISTYSLIIEEHTKLFINNYKNIDEEFDSLMYNTICNRLKENNFLHYEISNFAKEGYESIHNKTYWNNDNYYGFGLGASSYINNIRCTNTKSLTKYFNEDFIDTKDLLNEKEIIEYEIILNLRLNTGINLINFKNKFNKDLKELYNYKNLIEKKLLILEHNNLYIPEDKWYISNSIIVKLLEGEIDGQNKRI